MVAGCRQPHRSLCDETGPVTGSTNEALRAALVAMYHDDRAALDAVYTRAETHRRAFAASRTPATTTPWPYALFEWAPADQAPPEIQAALAVVRRNTAALKAIVAAHGWPGRDLVGADGAQAAWLILQHAGSGVSTIGTPDNHAFRRACVPLLTDAVRRGQAHPRHLAHVVDGIRAVAGQAPVYAVLSTAYTVADGRPVPRAGTDVEGIDRRRGAIGLRPVRDDLHRMAAGERRGGVDPGTWEPWPQGRPATS